MGSLWIAAAGGAVMALVASLAEQRRHRRTTLDAVGWMPWSGVIYLGLLVALIAAGYAIALGDGELP